MPFQKPGKGPVRITDTATGKRPAVKPTHASLHPAASPRPSAQPPRPAVQPPRPAVQPPRPAVQPPRPAVQPPRPAVQPVVQPYVRPLMNSSKTVVSTYSNTAAAAGSLLGSRAEQEAAIGSLPACCPFCGAPTARSLTCEYCGRKLN